MKEEMSKEQLLLEIDRLNHRISELEKSETQFKVDESFLRSEERFWMFFKRSKAVILLIDSGSGDIIDANPAAAKFYGYSVEVLHSMNIGQINQLPPEEIAIQREHARNEDLNYFIFPHKLADGEIRTVEVFSSPIPFNDKIILFSIVNDITHRQEAEKALQESEERFRLALDATHDGLWEWGPADDNVFYSPAFTRILGYSSEELEEDHQLIEKNIHPHDRDEAMQNFNDHLSGKTDSFISEHRVRTKEGEWKWLLSRGQVVKNDSEGAPTRVIGTIKDINQRKQVESALLESEDKYRTLFEEGPDYTFLLGMDGTILDVNRATTEITGLSKNELIGSQFLSADLLFPEDMTSHMENIARIMQGERLKPFESRFMDKNGNVCWVYIHISTLMKNYDISSILVIASDITERKNAENALIDSEDRYRTLFESNPLYTIVLGLDGTILDVNDMAANLGGKTREEFLGKTSFELGIFPKEDISFHEERFISILNGEQLDPYESKIIIEGQERWLETIETGIKKDDELNSILVLSKDITERKKAEKKIKASLEEKTVLLREIHHRVNNNMQIISSLLNLQSRYVDGDDIALDVLMKSQNRVKSMAMIHEKLYKSQDLTHINFTDYIQSLVSDLFYSYKIKEDQIKLILEIEDVILNMETAVPCGLIISELVSNSLKYAFPEGINGEVLISLKSDGDTFGLIIGDNGIKFPEELDFKNTDSLGLTLVNSLVSQIDGEIELDRSHGTEFKITFKELKYKERF